MKKPLLSAYIITYNHRNHIKQAIESVLMQRVNFDWEIVIADDYSTDGTREIIEHYAKLYPQLIRTILQTKNVGACRNWLELLDSLRGRYVACLDGDDYWTDPSKLQKQVDFLESNQGFALCFHQVKMNFVGKNIDSKLVNTNQKEVTDFEDLAYRNYIHTSSCVFRNNLFGEFPEWFYKLNLGDWTLNLLNAQFGKIKFLDETMSVYNIHSGGSWSFQSSRYEMDSLANAAEHFQKYFHPKGEKGFKTVAGFLLSELCFSTFKDGSYDEAKNYCKRAIKMWKYLTIRKKVGLLTRYFLCFFPPIAQFYNKFIKTFNTT